VPVGTCPIGPAALRRAANLYIVRIGQGGLQALQFVLKILSARRTSSAFREDGLPELRSEPLFVSCPEAPPQIAQPGSARRNAQRESQYLRRC